MKNGILIILGLICGITQAQILNALVDESLIDKANTITLYDNTVFEISSPTSASKSQTYKMVIVNSNSSESKIVLPYNDFSKVKTAKVKVLNIYGKKIKSFSLKDFDDQSGKGYSIASSSRAKVLDIKNGSYPYIIEVEIEQEYSSSLFYPFWRPQPWQNHSVQNATFTINTNQSNPIRVQSHKLQLTDSMVVGDNIRMKWNVKNLKAVEFEDYSFRIEDYLPMISVAPKNFEVDGYQGDMSSWDSFGDWLTQLNSDQNDFSATDLAYFKEMTDSISSTEAKVRAVYDYLQNTTRYVSVQLGVGGWKPYSSNYVHQQKYGDCKALSFYTKSILEGIGIDAFYTTIYAGKDGSELDDQFPINRFNHVILTVPLENDTVWLECTSQTNPYGYMGTFTSDRDAFLINELGESQIIRTRVYDENDNIQNTKAFLKMDADGNARVTVKRIYQGIEIENDNFENVYLKIEKEKNEWFIDNHDWGAKTLKSLMVTPPSDNPIPTGSMTAELEIRNAGKIMGKRVFYQPFIFTNSTDLPTSDLERKYPFENRYAYTEIDTIQVEFPDHFSPENDFEPLIFETDFGVYQRQMIKDQNKYTFIRKFVFYKGRYEPSRFIEFMDFVKKIKKADKDRLVLINRT